MQVLRPTRMVRCQLGTCLRCAVEINDCVQVPGKEVMGWSVDKLEDLPSKPIANIDSSSLQGSWYKVMGLDSRYDCFDCQKNTFETVKGKNGILKMEAIFRIPRPNPPGYLQSKISEELLMTHSTANAGSNVAKVLSQFQSKGRMFGLTFWENWYILGDSSSSLSTSASRKSLPFPSSTQQSNPSSSAAPSTATNIQTTPSSSSTGDSISGSSPSSTAAPLSGNQISLPSAKVASKPDLRLIYYTGHTLQGSYKGSPLHTVLSYVLHTTFYILV